MVRRRPTIKVKVAHARAAFAPTLTPHLPFKLPPVGGSSMTRGCPPPTPPAPSCMHVSLCSVRFGFFLFCFFALLFCSRLFCKIERRGKLTNNSQKNKIRKKTRLCVLVPHTFRPACMLHVLVQFARTEYEYKPRKAKPSPPPKRSGPIWGWGSQLRPGHAYNFGSKYTY